MAIPTSRGYSIGGSICESDPAHEASSKTRLEVLEDPQKFIRVVRNALARKGAIFESYENIDGGDGVVCTGMWERGTAVVSWDGRSQVDVNLFIASASGNARTMTQKELLEEIKSLEGVIVPNTASTLKDSLRDVQPRGYGRVVNFHKDILAADTFFNHGHEQ